MIATKCVFVLSFTVLTIIFAYAKLMTQQAILRCRKLLLA